MTVTVDPVPAALLAPAPGERADFLLELRSEEIPARMQDKAREELAHRFWHEMAKAGMPQFDGIDTYATPRRLVLIARGLPSATPAVAEEVKGPKASAPPQALEGFLRKTGLAREQLVERNGVLFAVTEKPGRATAAVLAEAIPAIVRQFPWPKSMRWGAASSSTESPRWVRPLHGIVALLGESVVPVEVAGIASGATTLGHRFHHPGPITIGSAADYVEKLHACHVIVDQEERRRIIREGAATLAADAGLDLIADEGLVAENAGLTEWPVPLIGRFDADFLSVPPEVIQLTARVNQKYFVCRDADGALANAFICTANIAAPDGGARIVQGNAKVLAARLADARFFYEQDLKVPLDEQAGKLDRIVFHEKLGTVADKVDRVAKLARWLVEEGVILPGTGRGTSEAGGGVLPQAISPAETPLHHPADSSPPRAGEDREKLAAQAERAARLAKADLVTGMVGEFPELQGLMGGYYAAAQGEDPAVAEAIRDHYKPVGQGDDVPTAPVTVAVSLADKLDSLQQFFKVGEVPTGSKDPFALRRAALAIIRLITSNQLRLPLRKTISVELLAPLFARVRIFAEGERGAAAAIFVEFRDLLIDEEAASRRVRDAQFSELLHSVVPEARKRMSAVEQLLDFFADRLKVQQREAGVRHDLIDAVFALGGEDDLVRLLARVHALQGFVGTEDGANLLAGYKRAANILKKEGYPPSVAPAQAGGAGEGVGQEPRATPASAGVTGEADGSASGTARPDLLHDEAALHAALDAAEPRAQAAVAAQDFEGAMAALASLRAPIDAFFDTVTVNDSDPAKRDSRLALLARVRAAVHGVADFSRIEG